METATFNSIYEPVQLQVMEIRFTSFVPSQPQLYRFLRVMKLKQIVQSFSDETSPFHTSKRSSKQTTKQTTDKYRDVISTFLTKRELLAEKFCCKLSWRLFVTQQFLLIYLVYLLLPSIFLDGLAELLWKTALRIFRSFIQSVRKECRGLCLFEFPEISHLRFLLKFVDIFRSWLTSDTNGTLFK